MAFFELCARVIVLFNENNVGHIVPCIASGGWSLSKINLCDRVILSTLRVNRSAIVREIPHFGLFPAFLPERPE